MVRILHTLLRLSTALWVKSWGYLGNRSAQASATSELNLTKLISRNREVVYLIWLITKRSEVRILLPLLENIPASRTDENLQLWSPIR